jgi:hypothetical protein
MAPRATKPEVLERAPPRLPPRPRSLRHSCVGGFVERPQSVQDFVDRHALSRARGAAQGGSRLDRTGIRGPRSQNGAFFVQGQIRIVDHILRAIKRLRGMQKLVQIKVDWRA